MKKKMTNPTTPYANVRDHAPAVEAFIDMFSTTDQFKKLVDPTYSFLTAIPEDNRVEYILRLAYDVENDTLPIEDDITVSPNPEWISKAQFYHNGSKEDFKIELAKLLDTILTQQSDESPDCDFGREVIQNMMNKHKLGDYDQFAGKPRSSNLVPPKAKTAVNKLKKSGYVSKTKTPNGNKAR